MSAAGEVCLVNIGPKERSKRLRFGAVAFGLALAIAGGLLVSGVSAWWRLLLFLPFAGATTGFFQARRQT